ncbi:MAG: sulfatase-like hydrolase/transferase [Candidatus Eisenbacteria bacterium]|nr:sulfatase-like hydrolase/transferase [Candidatus Eisenbacteria bacterium]
MINEGKKRTGARRGESRKGKRRLLPLLFLLLGAALFASCAARREHPNVLLLVVDTLRADRLGSYGYGRETTPSLDRLAAESLRFERAYTTAPWTLPAFGSILTGRYPWEHGATNDYLAIRPDLPTLAAAFREGGWATAAFVSHIYTSSVYGFDAGFDRFEEFRVTRDYRFDEEREPRAERVAGEAIRWLRERDESRPFFLLVHIFDPHWTYAAPEPYTTLFDPDYNGDVDGSFRSLSRYFPVDSLMNDRDLEHVEALYDGEVRYADLWIGRLLDALRETGDWDKTVVVLTGDHGEEFQEHRSFGHSFTFYDEVLRVPLLLRDPGRPGGGTVEHPVSLVDLFPTLLRIAGLPAPEGLDGRPLDEEGEGRTILAGTTREGRYGRAALRGENKLVWDREGTRVYDRAADPAERAGRAASPDAGGTALAGPPTEENGGGWTIRWDAGDEPVEGAIDPSGVVIDILPLGPASFRTEASGNGPFRFTAPAGVAGGFRMRVVPPDGAVRFLLTRGSREEGTRIAVGPEGSAPPAPRFVLDPAAAPEGALDPPGPEAAARSDFLVGWTPSPGAPPPVIRLEDAERERLRALGYLGG